MAKKFEEISVGNQLELPYSAPGAEVWNNIRGGPGAIDPNRPCLAAIVTHIWFDPVDNKEYVAIAYIRRDGHYGKPTEKRTITGLARCGWKYATTDWIKRAKDISQAGDNKIIEFKMGKKR